MYKQFLYKFAERCGVHISAFVVNIVLARLLAPQAYGIMAVINAFITVSQVLLQGGLNTALIQKTDADEDEYFSISVITLAFSVVFCSILMLTAPLISSLYSDPTITAPLRVLSLVLIVQAVASVYNARVVAKMQFKVLMKATLCATLISGVICIGLAYAGAGIWALVVQQMLSAGLTTLLLMAQIRWIPKGKFDLKKAKKLFSFGWRIMVTNLIVRGNVEATALIIGKVFSPSVLAFYNRGKQFPQVVSDNIDGALQGVSLPVFAKEKEPEKIVAKLREFIDLSTFFLYPILALLAVLSGKIILILLKEQWLECVPFFIIWCIYYMLVSHTTLCTQAIIGVGDSSLALKRQILNTLISITTLVISIVIWKDAVIMLWCMLGAKVINTAITMKMCKTRLPYYYGAQLRDVLVNVPATAGSAFLAYAVSFCIENIYLEAFVQCVIMLVAYLLLSGIFNKSGLKSVLNTIGSLLKK